MSDQETDDGDLDDRLLQELEEETRIDTGDDSSDADWREGYENEAQLLDENEVQTCCFQERTRPNHCVETEIYTTRGHCETYQIPAIRLIVDGVRLDEYGCFLSL